jgi:hypothetical protein
MKLGLARDVVLPSTPLARAYRAVEQPPEAAV